MASIVNFSEAASIGIHSIIILARKKESLNAIELSQILGKSKHHIGKVLQRLVKMGFLESQRGPSGGFRFSGNSELISMYDIYVAVEGPVSVKDCDNHSSICPANKCIFNNVVKHLSVEFVDYMKSETLTNYI